MTNQQPLDDNMQERINNLFAGQEPPSHASIRDVEAMKARISQLEAELARQSGTERGDPGPTGQELIPARDIESRMRSARRSPSKDSQSDNNNRTQSASRILALPLGAIIVSLPIFLYWAVKTDAWQIYAIIAGLIAAGVLLGLGISLVRRNRIELAMELTIANACGIVSLIVGLISGVGVVLAATQFLIILAITGNSLSGLRATRALLAGFAFSIATLLLDLTAGWSRLSVPGLQSTIPPIAMILVLSLGFVVARQFQNYSLRNKLVLTFVVITLAAIGAVGYVTNRIATEQFNQEVGENFYELASRMARETGDSIHRNKLALDGMVLNRFIQDSVEQANQTGTSDLAVMDRFDQQWVAAPDNDPLITGVLTNEAAAELRKLQSRLPQYSELFVTDQYGALIASTNRTSDYYQADEEWWQKAWNNGSGRVFISQPTFDESAGVYAIDIALPIPAYKNSTVAGILRATVNITELTNLLAASQLGQTGQAVLALPDNQYLSRESNLGPSAFGPDTISEVSSLGGLFGQIVYEGTPSLVSKAPVTTIVNDANRIAIEQLGWTIIVHQDLPEAHAPIAATTRGIMMTAIGVLIASGLLALLIGGQVAKPIENLTSVAAEIASGDLFAEADQRSRDEIGTLAATFNRMTLQLRDTLFGLEQRVAERTHDLQLATGVGRSVSEKVGNLTEMLSQSVELIRSEYELYYAQIYLVDSSGRNLVLRAGTGDAGAQLLRGGHRLALSTHSLNSRAASSQKPVLVGDTRNSEDFLPNPLLPLTRSELAVPLIASDKVVGVLDMQSEKPDVFSEANLPAFQVLAGQLAIAIQNAALFKQTEEARLEVEEQARRLTSNGWQEFLNAVDRSEHIGYVFSQEEVLPLVETEKATFDNRLVVPIQITGATVGEVQLADDTSRVWTAAEKEIVQAAMSQVAQHIESLRLLAQAEQYRAEAEQVSRRLTSEGWNEYFQTHNDLAEGYSYSQNHVQPLNADEDHGSVPALSYPLIVRDEPIGVMLVDSNSAVESHAAEVVAAVVEQLGEHIENLRLLEQAEQRRLELQQGEARLRTLVEHAPEAIVVVDLSTGLFTEPNENATKLYGLSREDLVRVGPAQMSPPTQPDGRDSTEKAMEKIGEAMQGQAPIFDWIHRNAQGQDIPCEVRLVRLPGEKPLVRASVTDITERKRNQEILAQRANQLETVAALSSTASTVLDPDKLLQAVVDLTKERFGLYHAHIYLANDAWKTLILAAGAGDIGRKMVAQEHTISLETEKSLVARAAREKHSVIANDVRSQVDFLPNPLLPATRAEMAVPMIVGDKVLGVFDVQSANVDGFSKEDAAIYTTLASQVAIALQNARLYVEQAATVTQLRELDRLKSSFLANMSHELRTPLNSILGFADVMLEGLDGELTDYMDNDLRLIQRNGQHLLHLINDVLDMAKIESGRMNLSPEKFRLHTILEDVTGFTSTLASDKDLSLFIDENSDHEIEIYADSTRLRQVMINLVNNSIKFTQKGTVILSATSMNGAGVLITVKDTGLGIPPDKLEAIFQEFTQVDSSTTRKAGGTGLGLPISRRLVEMHGGRLWAESSGVEGEGSTFFVELPLEAKITEVI